MVTFKEIMEEVQASNNPIGVLRGYLAFLDPENDKELFKELIIKYNNLKTKNEGENKNKRNS